MRPHDNESSGTEASPAGAAPLSRERRGATLHEGVAVPAWTASVFLTSLALWVGAAVFLSAGVLPVLFTSLEPSEAGRMAALVFPIYFRAGLAVGIVATACALPLARRGGRRWQVALAVLAAMTLAQGWSALVLHPEMARIRGVADQVERFQYLHVLSVRLNSVVLGGGLSLLAAGGFLFAPRRGRT